MVICSVIPIDVYIYNIVNIIDGLPANDKEYTISIPRTPQKQFLTIDTYNSYVEEKDRIPDSLLVHTVGDLSSYYTKDQKNALISQKEGFFSNETQPVSDNGTTSITYSESSSSFSTYNYDLTAGAYIGGTIIVLEIEAESGYSYGYECEYSMGKGVEISGVVGCFNSSDDWASSTFNWGLMMIPAEIQYGDDVTQSFNLVTYWVE